MIDRLIIIKFLKFCVVGFSGMLIDFGTTWLLKEKAREYLLRKVYWLLFCIF